MGSIDVEEANIGIRLDEERIGNRYKPWNNFWPIVGSFAIMFGVAHYADIKWVVATGFALLITIHAEQDVRHFDVAVRIARTNLLLRDLMIVLSKRTLP
jgi:hypothetical protein